MEQLTNQAVQPVETKTIEMKRAYNRGGLGLGALYLIFQQIGSVFLIIAAVIGAMIAIVPNIDRFSGFAGDMEGILELLRVSNVMPWIVAAYVIGMVVGMIVGLLVMRRILTKRVPIERKNLGFGEFLCIALIAYGIWGVGAVIGNLPSFFGVTESNGLDELLNGLKQQAWPMYLYVCVGAPVFEELACRKLLLDRLHGYGEGFAMLVSALLFGLIHGNSGQFFLAFFLGMLFAMVYMRTGRIIYTMLLHGMINLTASLPELFAMFDLDIELGWNVAVGCLVLIGLVVLLIKRKDPVLHPAKSDVPDAKRSTWHNTGMILMRVIGLVMLGFADLMMMVMALLGEQGAAACLRLVPMTLAIVLVLTLPAWSKRYEAEAADPAEPAAPEAV